MTGESPVPAADDSPHAVAISVVVPAYNAAAHIPRALDSVLGQTHPPAEIIVGEGKCGGLEPLCWVNMFSYNPL